MLFDIDAFISKEEIAERLNIDVKKIRAENTDFITSGIMLTDDLNQAYLQSKELLKPLSEKKSFDIDKAHEVNIVDAVFKAVKSISNKDKVNILKQAYRKSEAAIKEKNEIINTNLKSTLNDYLDKYPEILENALNEVISNESVNKIQELTKEIEAIASSDDIQKLKKNDFLEVYDANDLFDVSIENPTLTQILVVPTKKFDTILKSLKDVPDFDTVYFSYGFGYFAASDSLDADINAVNGNELSYYDVDNFKISPDIDIHNEDLKKFISSLCDLALKVRNLYIQENYQIQDIDSIDANAVSNNLIRKAKFFPETKEELKALCDDLSVYLGVIDTSRITDMSYLFKDSQRTNIRFRGIEKWDVSKVENMNGMFNAASNFNRDISNWDVSNVTDMTAMFENAEKFNQSLDTWTINDECFISSFARKCPIENDLTKLPKAVVEDLIKQNDETYTQEQLDAVAEKFSLDISNIKPKPQIEDLIEENSISR